MIDHPLIVGALIGGSPILIIATVAWLGRRDKNSELSAGGGYFLRYCSANRFKRWWKFFPWEGVGILKVEGDVLVFEGHPNKGDKFTINAPLDQLEFHGRRNWFRNGLLPWLLLKSQPDEYYLCVETGPLILGAGKKTRQLLALIHKQTGQATQTTAGKPFVSDA